jgi:hypothetical protein
MVRAFQNRRCDVVEAQLPVLGNPQRYRPVRAALRDLEVPPFFKGGGKLFRVEALADLLRPG